MTHPAHRITAISRAHRDESPSKEIQKLTTLLHVSQALASTLDLKAALHDVLDTLARQHQALRSLVVLVNKDTQELAVEASEGGARPGGPPRYAVGEGVVGKVVESGKPIIVPRVSLEPSLHASARHDAHHEEHSFFCVPISIDRAPVGALGITVRFSPPSRRCRVRAPIRPRR